MPESKSLPNEILVHILQYLFLEELIKVYDAGGFFICLISSRTWSTLSRKMLSLKQLDHPIIQMISCLRLRLRSEELSIPWSSHFIGSEIIGIPLSSHLTNLTIENNLVRFITLNAFPPNLVNLSLRSISFTSLKTLMFLKRLTCYQTPKINMSAISIDNLPLSLESLIVSYSCVGWKNKNLPNLRLAQFFGCYCVITALIDPTKCDIRFFHISNVHAIHGIIQKYPTTMSVISIDDTREIDSFDDDRLIRSGKLYFDGLYKIRDEDSFLRYESFYHQANIPSETIISQFNAIARQCRYRTIYPNAM